MRTTVTLSENIGKFAAERAQKDSKSLAACIADDISLLYPFLEREKKLLRGQFTPAEAKLMIDCLNGTIMDQVSIQMIEAGFQDGIKFDRLDRKWEIDSEIFLQKFNNMSVLRKWAIFELIQDFWNLVSQNPEVDLDDYVQQNF